MQKIFLLCIGISTIFFIGCATIQKQSSTEIIDLRDAREKSSKYYFNNITRSDVELAVVKLFNLLDGQDVQFDIRRDKILVSRWWTYYAVLSVGFGKDFWEINLTEKEKGIEVSAAFTSESNHGPFAGHVSTPFKENIGIGGNILDGASVADYQLLYSRIEYLLGRKDSWMTCEEAKHIRGNSKEQIVLCERIGIDDMSPNDMKSLKGGTIKINTLQ